MILSSLENDNKKRKEKTGEIIKWIQNKDLNLSSAHFPGLCRLNCGLLTSILALMRSSLSILWEVDQTPWLSRSALPPGLATYNPSVGTALIALPSNARAG